MTPAPDLRALLREASDLLREVAEGFHAIRFHSDSERLNALADRIDEALWREVMSTNASTSLNHPYDGTSERNAVIESARIDIDDHGCLTAWLMLNYGDSGQGFGGFALYLPKDYAHHGDTMRVNYAGHFIWRCLEIAGVTEWRNIVGKTIRVRHSMTAVKAIGHIVKDDWFDPGADFAALGTEAPSYASPEPGKDDGGPK